MNNTLASVGYNATEEQVYELARMAADGRRSEGTYLRVVIAGAQMLLMGIIGWPKLDEQLAALRNVHERYYPAVLRGVGGDALAAAERNRKATFARTAVSTVRQFVRNGGNLCTLDVATVSKGALRLASHPRHVNNARSLATCTTALVRAAGRMLTEDPAKARAQLEVAQGQLRDAIKLLTPATPVKRKVGRPRKVMSTPVRVRPRGPVEHRAGL